MAIRAIQTVFNSQPTREGAGVRLKRAFGFNQLPRFDPFLILDDFRSAHREDFQAGFPWHPHRGMETITYVLAGQVEHEDSLGNHGRIADGDVQWMTAGSGIIHQEMPLGTPQGTLQGFQLWANLPAKYKLMDPRYQDVSRASIPDVALPGGGRIRVIAGKYGSIRGPVEDIITEPEFLDILLPSGTVLEHPVKSGHTAFAFMLDGALASQGRPDFFTNGQVLLFDSGDRVRVQAGDKGANFLLISGRPLHEPISWHGPIVMNTHAEIEAALDELDRGQFIKVGKHPLRFP